MSQRDLPPLAAVRVFEAAARHLSFTRAADELGMTQAAVSYQIKVLEERVGAPLFLRLTRAVALTQAGRLLAPATSEALDLLAAAFAAARKDTGGVLSLSVVPTFAAHWLAPRIGGFQLKHPDIAVRINATREIADFTRDDIDMAVRSGDGKWPGLVAHKLMEVDFAPMLSPRLADRLGAPAEPADLLGFPLIGPEDPWWAAWFAANGVAGYTPGGRPITRMGDQLLEARAAIGWTGRGDPDSRLLHDRGRQRPAHAAVRHGDGRPRLLAVRPAGAPQRAQDPRLSRVDAGRTGGVRGRIRQARVQRRRRSLSGWNRRSKAADGADGADARHRVGERLDDDRHLVAAGVEQVFAVDHDADVARPEDEIAAAEVRRAAFDRCADHALLQVGVARRVVAGGHQGELHEAGAIEPEAGAPAPEIGRAEEALGDGDEIGFRRRVDRRDMDGDHGPLPAGKQAIGACRGSRPRRQAPGGCPATGRRGPAASGRGRDRGRCGAPLTRWVGSGAAAPSASVGT